MSVGRNPVLLSALSNSLEMKQKENTALRKQFASRDVIGVSSIQKYIYVIS